ncbi:ABC transporter substrate-binding protein [Algicola sagamiensis]|uniref:ABC transporter substrate-binding protein n=1 Tax=Algicola sagamiensis TaxID=163869 RepID=UPI0003640878|nr:ABC transporter substrate-binding protein [Algicola sagamiensis]
MHQFQFAGYYAAKEKGFFQKAGFDVTIQQRNIQSTPVEEVISGRAHFGVADSSIVLQRLKGDPVVVISTIFQTSPLVFMSLKEKGIKSPYDLAGKRLMFQRSIDDASLMAMLQMFHLKEENYEFIPHNFDNWALEKETADVMSAYLTDQPNLYQYKNIEVNIIDPTSYGIDFYGDLLFAHQDDVQSDVERIQRFVNAVHLGWQYALNHPEEIATLILDKYNPEQTLTKSQLLAEANSTKQIIKYGQVKLGTIYPMRFYRIADTYKELGLIEENKVLSGLLLSDYEQALFKVDRRLFYVLVTVALAAFVFTASQVWFNRRLKRVVTEKTEALTLANAALSNNLSLVETMNDELKEAKKLAEQANEAKSSFLANMSHELRTPMNGVLGTLQILQQTIISPEKKLIISKTLFSARSLLTIVNDILDYSKIEAGMLSIESVQFRFDELVQQVMSDMASIVESKEIELRYIQDELYEEGWIGDPVRIKQVLLNLVSNAVKFTHEGQVTIYVKSRMVIGEGVQLSFSVEDTGIGMSEEHLKRLFSRFEQADSSTTRKYGGTGLGMAITKNLVEMMGGNISVFSCPGQGTQMDVNLPLESVDVQPIEKRGGGTLLEPPNLEGKVIVLAEDNEVNQMVFDAMMSATNATVRIASHGKQALEFIEAYKPDLIFLDIQMPVMDGCEAMRHIQKRWPGIPVVALTANVMVEDIRHYKEVGFHSHLGKPIEMKLLYEICEAYLGRV